MGARRCYLLGLMSDRIHQTRLPLITRSLEEAARVCATAEQEIAEFSRLILSSGGNVPRDSPLRRSLDQYVSAARFLASRAAASDDDVSNVKEAMRVQFVVRAVLAAAAHPVRRLDEKLSRIAGEDVIVSGESAAPSSARDTMWEIVTAGLCAEFARDVAMLEAEGDQSPDVGCTLDGVRWCIECKMLRTSDPNRQRDRVIDGAKQVQACDDAERGLVFVNLTDALHHLPWSDPMPLSRSRELFVDAMNEMVLGLDRRPTFDRLGKRPKARSFMLFGQTMLDTGEGVMFTTIATWPRGLPAGGSDQGEAALLAGFNVAARALAGGA